MWQLKNVSDNTTRDCPIRPEWSDGVWKCGDINVIDADGTAYQVIEPAPIPPTVGPIHFKMLFTPAERIKAKSLRATDPGIEDFWSLLDDPRTTEINIALASVQDAIEYTLAAVKAAGVAVDVPVRKAEILSGVLN